MIKRLRQSLSSQNDWLTHLLLSFAFPHHSLLAPAALFLRLSPWASISGQSQTSVASVAPCFLRVVFLSKFIFLKFSCIGGLVVSIGLADVWGVVSPMSVNLSPMHQSNALASIRLRCFAAHVLAMPEESFSF